MPPWRDSGYNYPLPTQETDSCTHLPVPAMTNNQTIPLVEQIKEQAQQLAPHFKPAVLQREATEFQFQFDQGEAFYLLVSDGKYEFIVGRADSPTLTLYLDTHDTCWQLLRGSMDSMAAFMEGKYRSDGNIVLSQLLLYLFRGDDPTIAYQVQD